jgi:uncharacterized membrane protein (UPF0127 family)
VQRFAAILFPALAVLLAACGPATPPATGAEGRSAARSSSWLDDGKPQTGLPRMKLYLGSRELDAELAVTQASIQKGMMWRTNVAETEGMLFVFARPHQSGFWMKNVPIDIDVAYINPEGVILEVHRLQKHNTNPVPSKTDQVQFALETAAGWFERNGLGPGTVIRTDRGSLQETFFSGKWRP